MSTSSIFLKFNFKLFTDIVSGNDSFIHAISYTDPKDFDEPISEVYLKRNARLTTEQKPQRNENYEIRT